MWKNKPSASSITWWFKECEQPMKFWNWNIENCCKKPMSIGYLSGGMIHSSTCLWHFLIVWRMTSYNWLHSYRIINVGSVKNHWNNQPGYLYLDCSCDGETPKNPITCLHSTRNPRVMVSGRWVSAFGNGHEHGFHVEFCPCKSPCFFEINSHAVRG